MTQFRTPKQSRHVAETISRRTADFHLDKPPVIISTDYLTIP
jgi:hypothetical protein